ncbi:DNA breaking-rejoining protein [Microbulbifer hainanensis]|uniref:DNA breaking-rejoining protein n=1 Tax=Microbulbifer hainanensis TaxID=2735675 RepID=UPI0018683A0A|nr:DNA breaking-rejoining protein [Microbulbifer hainanensis]
MTLLQPLACAVLLCLSTQLLADESRTENIQFKAGSTGTKVQGSITGYETVNYKLRANAGQKMHVALTTDSGANYFNIYAPGKGPGDMAMFIGSTSGQKFAGKLPADGVYTIQVFQMRSAARRKETAKYTLKVKIDPDDAARTRKSKAQALASTRP